MPITYDLMLLLDAAAPTERRNEIVAEVEKLLGASGTIVARHDWGPRNMAYEIDHRPEGDYRLFQFQGPPEMLEGVDRTLRLTDGVLRHRIVKVKPGTPPPPEPRREQAEELAAVPDAAPEQIAEEPAEAPAAS